MSKEVVFGDNGILDLSPIVVVNSVSYSDLVSTSFEVAPWLLVALFFNNA
jgi:hypothetical protein